MNELDTFMKEILGVWATLLREKAKNEWESRAAEGTIEAEYARWEKLKNKLTPRSSSDYFETQAEIAMFGIF